MVPRTPIGVSGPMPVGVKRAWHTLLPMERGLHYAVPMRARSVVLLSLLALVVACKKRDRSGVVVVGAGDPSGAAAKPSEPNLGVEQDDENPKKGKGGGSGANKWRDVGVYVDGSPIGMLAFGELPIGLKPIWIEEQHSIDLEPGFKGPTTKTIAERRYRMLDYLKAAGVDVARVKEIHVMGPKLTEVIVASGKELRSAKGQQLMFRFGGGVGGKPIPVVPANFGNGIKPDKIGSVMLYINKKPPVLVPDQGLTLDGKEVEGVPYFGEPVKGGVRVYNDDRLALVIKRQQLEETPGEVGADGKQRWKLAALLKQSGVDLAKVVEAWAIADERRKQKFTRAELEALTFTMSPSEKNELLVGDGHLRVSALALHSHALKPDELPQIRADESVD